MMELHKLRCGIIYSREFAEYLTRKVSVESPDHPGELLSLEYIRCADGSNAGASWWQVAWVSLFAAPMEQRIQIGATEVFIHRQSRRGLKNRLLHFASGNVVVKQ